jgi:hypothetical protein
MTLNENAKMTMLTAVSTHLKNNVTVYTNEPLLNKAIVAFYATVDELKNKSQLAGVDLTGQTQEKLKLKEELASIASKLSGFALMKFKELGSLGLMSQLYINKREYVKITDQEAENNSENLYSLIQQHQSELVPDYITATEMTQLRDAIDAYKSIYGTNAAAHTSNPANRALFKQALADAEEAKKMVLLAARKVEDSHEAFYTGLQETSYIRETGIRHTSMVGMVTNEADGAALEGVIISIEGSDKTATTDANGHFAIEFVKNGSTKLYATKQGFASAERTTNISRGRENEINFELKLVS